MSSVVKIFTQIYDSSDNLAEYAISEPKNMVALVQSIADTGIVTVDQLQIIDKFVHNHELISFGQYPEVFAVGEMIDEKTLRILGYVSIEWEEDSWEGNVVYYRSTIKEVTPQKQMIYVFD